MFDFWSKAPYLSVKLSNVTERGLACILKRIKNRSPSKQTQSELDYTNPNVLCIGDVSVIAVSGQHMNYFAQGLVWIQATLITAVPFHQDFAGILGDCAFFLLQRYILTGLLTNISHIV